MTSKTASLVAESYNRGKGGKMPEYCPPILSMLETKGSKNTAKKGLKTKEVKDGKKRGKAYNGVRAPVLQAVVCVASQYLQSLRGRYVPVPETRRRTE